MSTSERKRECSRKKEFDPLSNKSKQICIHIEQETYARMLLEPQAFRTYLDAMIGLHPELFPPDIDRGYTLHDILPESKKMPGIRLRRIKMAVPESDEAQVYTIRPSFVLPYMTGSVDEVEKALFLRRWAVPYWGLAYVFGRDEQYWYRLENRLGRNSLVGTTVKDANKLSEHILADEKHAHFNGQKAYIATTVADDCVLGASVSLGADTEGLTEAYQHFKTEAQNLSADYAPKTVNTDGWAATRLAWQALFPLVTLILCFLHAFIKIRARCKRMADYVEIKRRVWETYHAADADTFKQRVAGLKAWALQTLPDGTGRESILKLCRKAPELVKAYAYPSAYRTSNMLDRHMEPLARYLDSCRAFHGHLLSAEYGTRAWALLHNFQPYCPRAKVAQCYQSPAHKLNSFVYHDNWLHNLLISASMGGYRQ
jgi:hypothetical protein